jgi:hypothetical protein
MPRLSRNRGAIAPKSSIVIEAEDRILRLTLSAARSADATVVLEVFAPESRTVLMRDHIDRIAAALRERV